MHTKLRNAIEETVKEVERELRQSQNEKVAKIADLWVRWNAREKSPSEVMYLLEKILKDEVDWAWKEFTKTNEKMPPVSKE